MLHVWNALASVAEHVSGKVAPHAAQPHGSLHGTPHMWMGPGAPLHCAPPRPTMRVTAALAAKSQICCHAASLTVSVPGKSMTHASSSAAQRLFASGLAHFMPSMAGKLGAVVQVAHASHFAKPSRLSCDSRTLTGSHVAPCLAIDA